MEDVSMPAPARTWVSNASLISGVAVAIGVFILGASNANIEGGADIAFGMAMSCWMGLPLILLGLVKLFRFFPNTHTVLWAVGCFALFGSCWNVYFVSKGSTAALALIFIPLFLLAGYGILAFVFFWRRSRSR
jgi:hypothetical protein